jgi:DNA repair photolyase
MRPVTNPPSRFDPRIVEWLEEPPTAELRVFEDSSREVLSANDSPDLGFAWSCNPYRGCQHGCAYCYARPTHEYLDFGAGTDFETNIVIKPEAPKLLREHFERRSWKGELVLFSGNVDCYQPLEAHYRLTRGCLEVCREYRNPCGVITRSALIERDLDLLAELHRDVGLEVTVSIPFHDTAVARAVEPMAPSPKRRFVTISRLASAGIPVGVNVAPLIPGLNDADVPAILKDAREAGARYATMILLRLPGSVATVFEQRLTESFPLRAASVMAKIRRMRGGALHDPRFGERMRGRGELWESTRRLFELWRERLGYERRPAVGSAPTPFRRPGPTGQLSMFGPQAPMFGPRAPMFGPKV